MPEISLWLQQASDINTPIRSKKSTEVVFRDIKRYHAEHEDSSTD